MNWVSSILGLTKSEKTSYPGRVPESGSVWPRRTVRSIPVSPTPAAPRSAELAMRGAPKEDRSGYEVLSHAPTRISFVGGGTDVTPFPETYGGAALNATISIYMTAQLRIRSDSKIIMHSNTRSKPMVYAGMDDLDLDGQLDFLKLIARKIWDRPEGFELFIYSSLPLHSGLGGSASMCVAVLSAFNHMRGEEQLDSYGLAEMAFEIEQKHLGNTCGRQDQYAASFGGINLFEFNGGGRVEVIPVHVPHACRATLNQALVLFAVGARRKASGNILEDLSAGMINDASRLEAMHKSKEMVPEMMEALQTVNVRKIGTLLHTLWQEKKRFCRHVSNGYINMMYSRLQEAGMIGGKITGAGGGGHLLACCDIERRDKVIKVAQKLGARVVPFALVSEGVLSWESPIRTVD